MFQEKLELRIREDRSFLIYTHIGGGKSLVRIPKVAEQDVGTLCRLLGIQPPASQKGESNPNEHWAFNHDENLVRRR